MPLNSYLKTGEPTLWKGMTIGRTKSSWPPIIPLVIPDSVFVLSSYEVYLIISPLILIYPGFVAETSKFSKLVNMPTELT